MSFLIRRENDFYETRTKESNINFKNWILVEKSDRLCVADTLVYAFFLGCPRFDVISDN